jgi:GNAT superfamily N-acetyltransferase
MERDRPLVQFSIREYEPADRPFLDRLAQRLHPGTTASPRDPEAMTAYFADLSTSHLFSVPRTAVFVAAAGSDRLGLIAVHPEQDHFTGHPRAYVDILVVAPEAEGRGVGRALLRHVERWSGERGCLEVVLDVFATKTDAALFYEHCGYRPDHMRMAKRLD